MSEKKHTENAFSEYFSIIQNVITRMAQNSFLIKAWSATLLAAIIVLTYSIINLLIFGVLLLIIIMFWYLDSYYLKLERLYRRLYNSKVEEYNDLSKRNNMVLFELNYKTFIKEEQKVLRIMISKSEALFYIPLIISLIIFFVTSILLFINAN